MRDGKIMVRRGYLCWSNNPRKQCCTADGGNSSVGVSLPTATPPVILVSSDSDQSLGQ